MHTVTFFYADCYGQMTIDIASWEIMHLEPTLEELRIHTAKHTLNIVIGSGFLGMFVYLPDHRAGFPATDLKNANDSSDYLNGILDCEDAAAVASVLQDYSSCLS